MSALRVENLTKIFVRALSRRSVLAVDHVNFSVEKGRIVGILGPNGAGKSTLLKMICGLIKPTYGNIFIYDKLLSKNQYSILSSIGTVLEGSRNSLWSMTVEQNLTYFGYLKNVHGRIMKKRIAQLLDLFDLEYKRHELVKNLSKGMKQKLAIALAFINEPDLILLDEPTLGLDVHTARLVKERIVQLARQHKRTILLSSHNMAVVEEISDDVAIINRGKLIIYDETKKVMGRIAQESYTIKVKGQPDIELLRHIPVVQDIKILKPLSRDEDLIIRVTMNSEDSLHEILQGLNKDGIKVLSVNKYKANLEDIFVRMVES